MPRQRRRMREPVLVWRQCFCGCRQSMAMLVLFAFVVVCIIVAVNKLDFWGRMGTTSPAEGLQGPAQPA